MTEHTALREVFMPKRLVLRLDELAWQNRERRTDTMRRAVEHLVNMNPRADDRVRNVAILEMVVSDTEGEEMQRVRFQTTDAAWEAVGIASWNLRTTKADALRRVATIMTEDIKEN